MSSTAEFEHEGIRLVGFSLAGEESFVAVPEMNLCFDVGRSPREVIAVDHVLLTHGHMDHSAGIAYYFAQRMFVDNAPGHLYAPEPLIAPIREMLRVWGQIDGHEPKAHLHAVTPDEPIVLRKNLVARPFRVNHACRREDRSQIDSLGYAVIEVRQKLKPEFEGLSGAQIVDQKRKGVEVTRRVELPLVTYCGDTGPGDFVLLDWVRNAKILLMECTFFEDEHKSRARAGKHMHVTDLREILPHLNNERIVLTHLSRRTSLTEARQVLRRVLGDGWSERISFLMEHRRRRRRPTSPLGNQEKGAE